MMKNLVLATTLAALSSASAFAADMPSRGMVAKAPMMARVSTWQGFYLGGNVGYGWGNGDVDLFPTATDIGPGTLDAKPQGIIGGAQIGYNWQMGTFITGLEADIQGSAIKGSSQALLLNTDNGTLSVNGSTSSKLSWFGTLRGRLGVAVTPDLLLYGTGGLAYGEVQHSANVQFPADTFPASISKTKAGWTAGAGGEWMFARNWSAKFEYLYVDLGDQSATAKDTNLGNPLSSVEYTWHTQDHIVRAGVNYHF